MPCASFYYGDLDNARYKTCNQCQKTLQAQPLSCGTIRKLFCIYSHTCQRSCDRTLVERNAFSGIIKGLQGNHIMWAWLWERENESHFKKTTLCQCNKSFSYRAIKTLMFYSRWLVNSHIAIKIIQLEKFKLPTSSSRNWFPLPSPPWPVVVT